jgi:hypothetical protein
MKKIKMKSKTAVEQLKDQLIDISSEDNTTKTFDKKSFENEAKKVKDTFCDTDENLLPSRNLI